MKITTNNSTGRVIFYPAHEPSPREGVTIREVTPAIQSVIDQGGPFLWVPDDEENPSGDGQLTKVPASANALLKQGLLAAWDQTFNVGEKAFLKPIFDAALAKFSAGDIEGAKEIISTAPSVAESLDQKRDSILALFPAE